MMNRDFVLKVLIVLCLAVLLCSAVSGSDVQWLSNFGGSSSDAFTSIANTSDGGFVAVGFSDGGEFGNSFGNGDWLGIVSKGFDDATIVKFDAQGSILWKKNFGGSDYDRFTSVTSSSDGGYVVVGYSSANSFGNGDWTGISSNGNRDAIIVKFDSQGNILWKKNFGGSGSDSFNSVDAAPDGGFVVVGSSYTFGNGDWAGLSGKGAEDAIAVKFDAEGNALWKKNFGGSGLDYFSSVVNTSDGGYVNVGYSSVFGNGDWTGISGKGSYGDAIIVKCDSEGNTLWKKNFGGAEYDVFYSVTSASDDGFAAVGKSNPSNGGDWAGTNWKGSSDAIIVRFDAQGNTLWKKNFGGNGSDSFYSVVADSDGGFVTVGNSYKDSFGTGDWAGISSKGGDYDAIIVKYDIDGILQWEKNFGSIGNDFFRSIASATDNSFVVVGSSSVNSFGYGDWAGIIGKGNEDAVIVKYKIINCVGISVDPTSVDIGIGYTRQLNATVFPSNATIKSTAWSSSNPAVAQVNGAGLVTAISFGSADITVRTLDGNFSAISQINVKSYINPISVSVDPTSATITIGRTLRLIATVSPSDTTNKNVTWSSSNNNIAAVDSNGIVTAMTAGNANIIVKTVDGNITAICAISVIQSNAQWLKNFGGNSSDSFNSIVNSSDGGFVAVGSSDQGSFGNGDWIGISSKGNSDAIIVKYDVDGNVLWKKNFGGIGADSFSSVVAVSDGGFVAVGSSYYNSFGTGDWVGVSGKGNYDAIIVKFDASGNVLWKKNFGGSHSDYFRGITNAPFEIGFAVVGYSENGSFGYGDWTGIIGKGYADAIIVRYSSNGDIYWKKNFGGSWDESFNSILTSSDDAFMAVGNSSDYGKSNIVKYSASGNLLWSKSLSNTFSLNSVAAAPDGGFVVVGEVDLAHNAIVKFNAQGDLIWNKSEEGYVFNAVTIAADGKITAVGYDWERSVRINNSLATIARYDQQGNKLIIRNFEGSFHDGFNAVTTTSDGGIVAVGSSSSFGSVDWAGISGKGGSDAIIVKISPISINGTINLQNFIGDKLGVSGKAEIRDNANGELIRSHPITLDSAGNYAFETILEGNYTISLKCSHWLSQSKPVSLGVGNNIVTFNLINGDCNNDNQVDESDLGILGDSWYLSAGELKYDRQADLNGDGAVDEIDLAILSDSWYQSGE